MSAALLNYYAGHVWVLWFASVNFIIDAIVCWKLIIVWIWRRFS